MELTEFLTDLVMNAPGSHLPADIALSPELAGMRYFDAPIVRVGDAHDPLFRKQQDRAAVGPWFRLPEEWLPGAERVISVFFPFSEEVKSREDPLSDEPSPAWLHARIEGHEFVGTVLAALKDRLISQGFRAVVPTQEKEFMSVWNPGSNSAFPFADASYSSLWSERHVAFVCGMGTFGLSGGLITEKGICGRLGSLVTDAPLPVTERDYTGIYEYCTRCGACARHCPAGAISLQSGKDHAPCGEKLNVTKKLYAPRYGCGKCQIGVPCTNGIPGRT